MRNNPVNWVDSTGHAEIEDEETGLLYRRTEDGTYRILQGGTRFQNKVEVDFANYILSGGTEEKYLQSITAYAEHCQTCIERSFAYVSAQLDHGEFNSLFELAVDPNFGVPLVIGLAKWASLMSPFGFPDPITGPGSGWVWRGKGQQGSDQGNWWNEQTGEWLHWDTSHHGINHWDYHAPNGKEYRIWPDGHMTIKK